MTTATAINTAPIIAVDAAGPGGPRSPLPAVLTAPGRARMGERSVLSIDPAHRDAAPER